MSGGSYDYIQYKLDDCADNLRARHPRNVAVLALADHFNALGKLMHDIELADSCDTSWEDNDAKIVALIGPAAVLGTAVLRAEEARESLVGALRDALATLSPEPRP